VSVRDATDTVETSNVSVDQAIC